MDFKRLTKFQRVIGVVVISIIFLAFVDIMGIPIWNTESTQLYGQIFWTFAYTIAIAISIVYFILVRDKSEAVAIFLSFVILLKFGLQDITFYIIRGEIPQSMPHLFNHKIMGGIARLMGLETVTPTSLKISVLVGVILTFFVVKWLKKI